jgi:ion channel
VEVHAPAKASRLFAFLFLSTVVSVAAQGVLEAGDVRNVLVTTLATASLLLALRAAELAPRLFALAAAGAAVVVTLSLVRAFGADIGEGAARAMNAALVTLAPPAVVIAVVRDLRSSGQVRLEAVLGVLSLYMLIGMAFAFTYGAVDRFGDTAFFTDGDLATVSNCLYFSFTTLTTVGYGDFAAATSLGHTLAVFEALIGQIYLVTIVSLIVSNLGRPARRRA